MRNPISVIDHLIYSVKYKDIIIEAILKHINQGGYENLFEYLLEKQEFNLFYINNVINI